MTILVTILAIVLASAAGDEAAGGQNQSRLKRPAITVQDLDRSVAFYRDIVGFTVAHQDKEFTAVSNPFDLKMMGLPINTLRRVSILNTASEPRGFVLQSFRPSPSIATQGQLLLVFQTTDFDGLHQRLEAAGHEVQVAQAGEGAWFRELGVQDPDGHALTFYMLLSQSSN